MATKLPEVSDRPELTTTPTQRRPPARKRRRSYAGVWLLLLAGLGFVGYRIYGNFQQQQQAEVARLEKRQGNRPVSVIAAAVRSGEIPVYLRGLGSVTPFNTVTVKSRVDGQLVAIHFTEGQMVHAGELLAEIDPRPYQVQLDQALGQLAKDQAQLKDAQANLSRYQLLWKEQVIPKQQLDTQAATVGQFQGAIQADQATIGNAKLQLTFCKITAPISGRVGLRLIDVGNMIHASDPGGLVVIDQMQPISVLFTIPADSLPQVLQKLRQGAKLHVDAYDREDVNKIASGTLLTVDNQIDPSTGTSRLKATFDNSDGVLFPNQFVNCRLLLDTKRGATIVSAPALQRGPQGTFVYVVTPQSTVEARPVTLGITEGDDVEIASGLKPGETVVVEGQDKLQDGSKVQVSMSGPGATGRRGRHRTPSATPQREVWTPPQPGQPPHASPLNPAQPAPAGQRRSATGRTDE